MKQIWHRFKLHALILLAVLFFIPIIVFGLNTVDSGFQLFSYWKSNPIVLSAISRSDTCINNNSSIDYFVPTKSSSEWDSFTAHLPANVTLGCCGNGFCDNSESCDTCPGDCGACPPAAVCGDGICGNGETSVSCPSDCKGCCVDTGGGGSCGSFSCTTLFGSNNYCLCSDGAYSTGNNGQPTSIFGTIDSNCRSLVGAQCSHYPYCMWLNAIPACNLWTGDGICSPSIGENCSSDPAECGSCYTCGNGVCESGYGENNTNCASDCPLSNSCTGAPGCQLYSTQLSCVKFGCIWNNAI